MIELRTDQAIAFSWYDADGLLPTSLTAKLYDRSAGLQATASVTLPTGSTTVHSQNADYFSVASSANFAAGDHISLQNDGVTYVRQLSRIESHAHPRFYLSSDLPVALDSADAIKSLTANISFAAVSAPIGDGYYVEIVATDAAGTIKRATIGAAVVRWTWEKCSAQNVADVMASVFQDERSHTFCQRVADRVNAKIENALDLSLIHI